MAENSKIEWTDHTFNPWVGCTKVSPACDHCYAEGWAKRTGSPELWNGTRRRTTPANWRKPINWNRRARENGRQDKVFCASLADVFDNQVPAEWRADLWNVIRETDNLTWLLLTKRPQNIAKMLPDDWDWIDGWPGVWLGTTAEDQKRWDHNVEALARVPAAVRFVSVEPMLEQIDVGNAFDTAVPDGSPYRPINWVICGGESGANARMMDRDWARGLRDQCALWNIPFFMKQMTRKAPIPPDLMVRESPASQQ